MAIYQRGKNWYIDFRFIGQRVRESIGPSRKDAEKIIAKRKTEIVENKYLDIRKETAPVKFHDFAKEYLKWAQGERKPANYKKLLSFVRQLNKEFETKIIQEITVWQIDKYKARRKEEVKPASVNRELAVLKHMFTKAIEWGKVKESPAKKVKLLKGEVKRVRFLMPEEVQTLFSNCAEQLDPIVAVAVNTGARKSELKCLEWDEVNFDQGIITLLDTKNGERRDVPMNETARAALKSIERRGERVFDFRNFRKAWEAALRKSGIQDFHFHDLRHTFASNLVMQEGVELNDVRELLGHKSMAMTLRYSHLSPKHKTRTVNMLDRVWTQISPQVQTEKKVLPLRR